MEEIGWEVECWRNAKRKGTEFWQGLDERSDIGGMPRRRDQSLADVGREVEYWRNAKIKGLINYREPAGRLGGWRDANKKG